MKIIVGAIFSIIAIAVLALYNGFIVSKLWTWFIMPTFKLDTITIGQAIGVSLFISYMQSGISLQIERIPNKLSGKPYSETVIQKMFEGLLVSNLFLGLGFIYSLFI